MHTEHSGRYGMTVVAFLLVWLTICAFGSTGIAEDTLTIATSMDLPVFREYARKTGAAVEIRNHEYDMMEAVANAFAVRDDQVDLLVFTPYAGLYTIKKKGYYEPLEQSDILREACQTLYPGFRKVAMDGERMACWILHAQPVVRAELTNVLEKHGLQSPQTFGQLLDVCSAIWESDGFGGDYCVFDTFSYCQEDMLDFYINQYMMACQVENLRVDLTDDDFLAMVKRIKQEVPRDNSMEYGMESDRMAVFSIPAAFEMISSSMLMIPYVLHEQSSALVSYATVAIINPYSKRKEEAMAFLEYCAMHPTGNAQFFQRTMTRPIENEHVLKEIERLEEEIALLEETASTTREERDRIAALREQKERYEDSRFLVSGKAVSFYEKMAEDLFVFEGSPLDYDSVLRALARRYLQSGMDEVEFGELCQRHIDMIYDEM